LISNRVLRNVPSYFVKIVFMYCIEGFPPLNLSANFLVTLELRKSNYVGNRLW